jgi:hypothetical protein
MKLASKLCVVTGVQFPAALPGVAFKTHYAFLVLRTCGVFAGLPSLCAWVSDNVRSTTAGSLASGFNIAFTGPR